MKRITIRDLRQHWPQAERLLQHEPELLITRDGRPVAKLVRVRDERAKRPRFDPEAHRRWQIKVFGTGHTEHGVDEAMERSRRERCG
jgi:antitoxin (DNA-binding transcriptional repressor) of toxin-antitoxin stability system